MENKPLKTVRFAKLVEESGKPEPVTLWTDPQNDREFSNAMRQNRVLTVVQSNVGAKADYGLVGFFKEPLATFLVFPKKLRHPPGTKVVGIKYEQLAESKPRRPVHKPRPEGPVGVRMRAQVMSSSDEASAQSTRPVSDSATRSEPERVKPKAPEAAPPPPKLFRFRANVEMTFQQVVPVEVEATSAKEAARLMKEKMAAMEPVLGSSTVKKRFDVLKRV